MEDITPSVTGAGFACVMVMTLPFHFGAGLLRPVACPSIVRPLARLSGELRSGVTAVLGEVTNYAGDFALSVSMPRASEGQWVLSGCAAVGFEACYARLAQWACGGCGDVPSFGLPLIAARVFGPDLRRR